MYQLRKGILEEEHLNTASNGYVIAPGLNNLITTKSRLSQNGC